MKDAPLRSPLDLHPVQPASISFHTSRLAARTTPVSLLEWGVPVPPELPARPRQGEDARGSAVLEVAGGHRPGLGRDGELHHPDPHVMAFLMHDEVALQELAHDHLRHQHGAADMVDAEPGKDVSLLRIVEARHHGYVVYALGYLRDHEVGVVEVGDGGQGARILDAGLNQQAFVEGDAGKGDAVEGPPQPREGSLVAIDHHHVVPVVG